MSESLIKIIQAKDTYPLRSKVLRPGMDISTCFFSEDDKPSTFHLGLFHQERLTTIATFQKESHEYFDYYSQYRLRGMATDPNFQGQGFGAKILKHSFSILKEKKIQLLWCNARIKALEFYQRLKLQTHGDVFDIPTVGPHYVMSINLT